MQSSKTLRFAGDVSIDKIQIITSSGFYQDITGQVITMQFYEDLFSPFISGTIYIKESLDFVNLFPFVGEEFVDMEITTPSSDKPGIKGRYYIYKLSNRELIGDRSVVYELHFISVEALIDMNKKVSKVYVGNVSDLVKGFLTDKTNGLQTKKDVFVDPTIKNAKFISNYWSPVKCINYLTDFAVNKNNTPDYVFFENRYGFYFVSLDSLYTNGVYQDFTYDAYTRDKLPNGGDVRNIQEDFRRIENITVPTGYDYIDRLRSGMFSSKMTSFDLNKKIYNVKNLLKINFYSPLTINKINKYSEEIKILEGILRDKSLVEKKYNEIKK